MKRTSPVSPPLQTLITQKMSEKGLSRPELVSAIGYTNVSKGCRRLHTFLKTLAAPSEDFLINLSKVLEIDPITYNHALAVSLDEFNANAKRTFQPYIQIKLGIRISPVFAAQMVHSQCSIPLPSTILKMPLNDEISAITALCKDHIVTVLNDNLSKHIIGFQYHRQHNYYMSFTTAYVLEEDVVFVQSTPRGKRLLGNRVTNLLSGGGII